jgi:hypothetical protein
MGVMTVVRQYQRGINLVGSGAVTIALDGVSAIVESSTGSN